MKHHVASRLLVSLIAASACSAHRLPPGTLPPEYEPPIVSQWPGSDRADAGALPAANPQNPADRGALTAPDASPFTRPELSPDAGVR